MVDVRARTGIRITALALNRRLLGGFQRPGYAKFIIHGGKIMTNLTIQIPKIIKKLDAAREALNDLVEITESKSLPDYDARSKLRTDLREFADYLESATWWKRNGRDTKRG